MNAIEVENLSKKFLIQKKQNSDFYTLRDKLSFRGRRKKEYFWSLRNINLKIKQGEIVGLIGPNGAGKSTFLKILSKIMYPTEGRVVMRGRVASILEVGTGFHPELTGRENVYLNGAILGMHKEEIDKQIDKIIDFSEINEFIDTPVKFYSSGMYTRIAFSIIAFLDIDILLIDEVLAVGDLAFHKKSLAKMKEIAGEEGKTILFVSHNMDMIKEVCKKTIFLDGGSIKMFSETESAVGSYISKYEI